MGAHTFTFSIGGKGMTPEKAYGDAVDAATYSQGHDAYNGTISTCSGFMLLKPPPRVDVHDYIDRELMNRHGPIQKWGPAGCIELKGKPLTEWRAANSLKGTRARAFTFFGWAAS